MLTTIGLGEVDPRPEGFGSTISKPSDHNVHTAAIMDTVVPVYADTIPISRKRFFASRESRRVFDQPARDLAGWLKSAFPINESADDNSQRGIPARNIKARASSSYRMLLMTSTGGTEKIADAGLGFHAQAARDLLTR